MLIVNLVYNKIQPWEFLNGDVVHFVGSHFKFDASFVGERVDGRLQNGLLFASCNQSRNYGRSKLKKQKL